MDEFALPKLIRIARESQALNQDELAARIDRTRQWVYRLEAGKEAPSLTLLLRLYATLAGNTQPRPIGAVSDRSNIVFQDADLAFWLRAWLSQQLEQTVDRCETLLARSESWEDLGAKDKRTLSDFQQLPRDLPARAKEVLAQVPSPLVRPTLAYDPSQPRTLRDLRMLEPLTIVLPDRREPIPQTIGDIFAYSLAVTEIMFLPRLALNPQHVSIVSDKLFSILDDKDLNERFGNTNLLIIGSPAVNMAARIINMHSIFRFDFDENMKLWQKKLREMGKDHLGDSEYVQVFSMMAMNPKNSDISTYRNSGIPDKDLNALLRLLGDLVENDEIKSLMHRFKKPGFIDPADGALHGESLRQNNDFGVVSVAENPYYAHRQRDAKYVCVMVGGVHGPGTALGVKALAEDSFVDHPLGGVIEVRIDINKEWSRRITEASWEWQTEPYTPAQLVDRLQLAMSQQGLRRAGRAFLKMTPSEIEGTLKFVRRLGGRAVEDT